jgi:prepilin-type N-terminal cleavage/methylation domain-containing protein
VSQRGFTLIEVLLSVTILAMLVGLSLPVYETFVRRNDLDLTAQATVSAIRRAEAYSRSVNQDSQWGIELVAPGITVFKGDTYATRDAAFDEIIMLPNSISVSGISEIVFAKLSATPNATGTISFTTTTNDTRTITINGKGMVSY